MDKRYDIQNYPHKERFINALKNLYTSSSNDYQDFFNKWYNALAYHNSSEFSLQWNRVFLRELEIELRKHDTIENPKEDKLTLPYWDWTNKKSHLTVFDAKFMGQTNENGQLTPKSCVHFHDWTLNIPKTTKSIKIERNAHFSPFPNREDEKIVHQSLFFSRISNKNENGIAFNSIMKSNLELRVKSSIGGTFSKLFYSFADPIYILVHSNLDRIWTKWQLKNLDKKHMIDFTELDLQFSNLNDLEINTQQFNEYLFPMAGIGDKEGYQYDDGPTESQIKIRNS